jgi:F-type H+-transporting ATPase subunit gamma
VAGGTERTLKRRIKSVESTRKTTRAMELIAGSRIVRAQARIVGARPYVERLEQLTADLAAAPGVSDHRFLQAPDAGAPVMLVVLAGDRGLSGPYNSSVLRLAEHAMAEQDSQGKTRQLVVVGRKGIGYLRFRGQTVDRDFTGMTDRPSFEDARRLSDALLGPFMAGEVGSVELVSTRFLSVGAQRVERRRLAPLAADVAEQGRQHDYEMEPEAEQLLEILVPQLVEARVFLALLEAAASQHAAQQRAMKAATDNADELITTYRRAMNRARQDAITTEIMEIVGGAEALRQAGLSDEDQGPAFTEQGVSRT